MVSSEQTCGPTMIQTQRSMKATGTVRWAKQTWCMLYPFSLTSGQFGTGYIYYASMWKWYSGVIMFLPLWHAPETVLAVYYDFDEGNGAFVLASIGHSLEVAKGISLNLGAYASYNINNKVMGLDWRRRRFQPISTMLSCLHLWIFLSGRLSRLRQRCLLVSAEWWFRDAIKSISDDGDKDIFLRRDEYNV